MIDKIKIHEFYLNPYPRKLWVVNGGDPDFIKSNFCKRDNSELDCDEELGNENTARVAAVTKKDSGKYGFLVWIKCDLSNKLICHESLHVCASLFNDLGSYLDPDNQEPFAYSLQHIFECIEIVNKEI